MGEKINIEDWLNRKVEEALDDTHGPARKLLSEMPADQVKQVVEFIANSLLEEVKAGVVGEVDEDDAPFFKLVDQAYDKVRATGCYFCDNMIDPNETEFNLGMSHLCMFCRMKLANFLKFLGIRPADVFPGIGERHVQKTTLHNTSRR